VHRYVFYYQDSDQRDSDASCMCLMTDTTRVRIEYWLGKVLRRWQNNERAQSRDTLGLDKGIMLNFRNINSRQGFCVRRFEFPILYESCKMKGHEIFLQCNNSFMIIGNAVPQWLRYCATNRKVAGSIPDGIIGIFHRHNPSGRTIALGSTQPLTEMCKGKGKSVPLQVRCAQKVPRS